MRALPGKPAKGSLEWPAEQAWGRQDQAAFAGLRQIVAGASYMSPEVRRLLNCPEDVSQPVPAFGFPRYIEEGLLDHLIGS